MDGTSCDRHIGSLDEPRNRWPEGLKSRFRSFQEALDMAPEDEEFQVRGPLLCLYLDRAMTEATWQQIQLDWGKNVFFCSMSWKMYEDVWINEDVNNWRWKIYRELMDGELMNCATISSTCLMSTLNSPQLLKKRHSNNHGFSVDLFYPPATSASTDPKFHKKLGFMKPFLSGSWVTSEGTFVWSSYERWEMMPFGGIGCSHAHRLILRAWWSCT